MEMSQNPLPSPPIARKEHSETNLHGVVLADDYAWLRDKENPDVTAYLEAENAYADAVMAPLASLRETLYQEMLSHMKQTDVSVPYRDGAWWYYTRTEEGLQYGIHCRKRGGRRGPRTRSERRSGAGRKSSWRRGMRFFRLATPTSRMTAAGWLTRPTPQAFANTRCALRILRPARRWRARSSASDRSSGQRTIGRFFTRSKTSSRSGSSSFGSTCVARNAAKICWSFRMTTSASTLLPGRTRDGKYIVVESASHITSEAGFCAADDPAGSFAVIAPREDEHEYSVDHRNGLWFIRTNDRGRNFRLVTAPVATPGREHWTERIAHRDAVMLEDVDLFAGFFIACEREDGLPRLRLWSFAGDGPDAERAGEIAFPEPAYSAHPHINRIFDATTFRYAYQSLVTPSSVYEYDVATGASTLLKQLEIPGGFDRTLYASERVRATAPDGVEVPVSIVYRRDMREPGKNPLYVYGYGSYGYSLPLGFSSNRLSLLDRGVVMAYAHIRGGGDLGEPWHDAGKMLVKRNTFTDFIACVEHLTAQVTAIPGAWRSRADRRADC